MTQKSVLRAMTVSRRREHAEVMSNLRETSARAINRAVLNNTAGCVFSAGNAIKKFTRHSCTGTSGRCNITF